MTSPVAAADSINAVLGNASWEGDPTGASEADRIAAHLAFVERRLRAQQASPARKHLLDLLAAYRERGRFPRRTGDAYEGRRPRFVDDRGVFCAVGHLIAMTGEAAFAKEIGRNFEYAYLSEIDDPRIDAWAVRHDITRHELAMIQPEYRPLVPWEPGTLRAHLGSRATEFLFDCAREHPAERTVRLRVAIRHNAEARNPVVFAEGERTPFKECVAALAQEQLQPLWIHESERPAHLYVLVVLSLRSPNDMLEAYLDNTQLTFQNTRCLRQGPVPREGQIHVSVAQRIRVRVETAPANRAVASCVEDFVRRHLPFPPGRWSLRYERRFTFGTLFEESLLDRLARGAIGSSRCQEPASADSRVVVQTFADENRIAVEVVGGSPAFRECLRAHITGSLARAFAPEGTDGSLVVDNDVQLTFSLFSSGASYRLRVSRVE
ncbi:MAG: hypothetical protein AAGE52_33270 [Myxococcota bacterium]